MPDIRCPLDQAAAEFGDQLALVSDKEKITYRQYNQLVNATTSMLEQKGIRPLDRVAILADNSVEYAVLLWSIFRLGAVACPISPRWPSEMVSSYLTRIGCLHLVVEKSFALRLHSGRQPARESLDIQTLDAIVMSEVERDTISSNITLSTDQDATIIATSGTSANPKAVLHSFGNHYFNALGSNENIVLAPGDRWLLALPLYHVGGLAILFRTALTGAAVVFHSCDDDLVTLINRHSVSHLSVVATQLQRLINDQSLSKAIQQPKAVLVGGSSIPADLVARAYRLRLPLFTTYGLTEMASQVTTSWPRTSLSSSLTSGAVLPHRELAISSEGEILVKGDTLFLGYIEGDRIRLPLDENGWFHTGDLGVLDDEGNLTVAGRRDNMFVSGGENIHPESIEAAIGSLGGIDECVVVALPDAEFGFRPVAFVRMLSGVDMDADELRLSLRDSLPGYMVPVVFYSWPDSAEEGGLKPDRQYLTKLAQRLYTSQAT
ncbi:MAG: o-succinylbenzoate--CoA ligase [candidate division Zixibacteria bacterium]|nr:o-succinylbenzoate--CoA ligase [candidate division Zixibacteria bacterium]